MSFTLKKVINGEVQLFSTKKFLEILGDTANDEINLDGEAYRISSFVLIGGSGTGETYIWQTLSLTISETGQQIIILSEAITETNSLQLFINGVIYCYGNLKSYHISDTTLHWHGGFILEPTDSIYLKYVKTI